MGRSVTWDGSKGSSVLDELKRRPEVKSWSGDQSKWESKEGRKRSASSSEEEMDRGRTKKIKKRQEERNTDLNPFQDAQDYKNKGHNSFSREKYNRDSLRNYSGSRDRDHRDRRDSRDKYSRDYSRDRGRNGSSSNANHERPRKSWDHTYNREQGGSGDRGPRFPRPKTVY